MKVLIWNTYELKPKGGPSGYLFNIKNYMADTGRKELNFLSDFIDVCSLKRTNGVSFIYRVLRKFLNAFKVRNYLDIYIYISSLSSARKNYKVISDSLDINEYDFVHFHSSIELFQYYDFLVKNKFKGKILLTTHSPKATHIEILEDWYGYLLNDISKTILNMVEEIDYFAFSKANYLIFPDKSALEPYEAWDRFSEILENGLFYYVPTGINLPELQQGNNIRKIYNIPNHSFVVCYVGRHNEVKGYDLLKEFGQIILENYPNVYFLIAGVEKPISKFEHERWIEVGWTDKPYTIIGACDLFVLPNRQTFFDLILLEVLGLNKPVLLSLTGGNRFFQNENLDLYYFEGSNIKSMLYSFDKVYSDYLEQDFDRKINRDYIERNLTVKHYVSRYVDLLNELK